MESTIITLTSHGNAGWPASTTVEVVSLRGREALSRLYELEIGVRVTGADFTKPAELLDTRVTVTFHRANHETRDLRGVIAQLEQVFQNRTATTPYWIYRLTVMPAMYKLTRSRRSRMFRNQSALAVAKEVLQEYQDAGVIHTDSVTEIPSAANHAHLCQYRESDQHFVSRLLERDGISFWFDHDHADHKERLKLDDALPNRSVDAVACEIGRARNDGFYGFDAFSAQYAPAPASVWLDDYDYNSNTTRDYSPAASVPPLNESANAGTERDRYSADTAGLVSESAGAYASHLAQVRAQELGCEREVYRGAGDVRHLAPGACFTVNGWGDDDVSYRCTGIEHAARFVDDAAIEAALGITGLGLGLNEYRVQVTAIPGNTVFRPERCTPKPRIYGMVSGTVVSAGNLVDIDDQGRYLVALRFDQGPKRSNASTVRVRMMQPYGGSPEGFHFALHPGTEVMLAFEGGDPDRPFIAGAVPNAQKVSPVAAANATQNVIHTRGNNRIELDDKAEKEHVFIQATTSESLGSSPATSSIYLGASKARVGDASSGSDLKDAVSDYHLGIQTNGDGYLNVGEDWRHDTTGTVTEAVGGDHNHEVEGDMKSVINGDLTLEVKGTDERNVEVDSYEKVTGTKNEIFIGAKTEACIGGTNELVVGGFSEVLVGEKFDACLGGRRSVHLGSTFDFFFGLSTEIHTGMSMNFYAAPTLDFNLAGSTEFAAGYTNEFFLGPSNAFYLGPKLDVSLAGNNISLTQAHEISIEAGGSTTIKTPGSLDFELGFLSMSLKLISIDLANVQLDNGDVEVKLKGFTFFG